jgi:periplasmic divalent cation tolerance protein
VALLDLPSRFGVSMVDNVGQAHAHDRARPDLCTFFLPHFDENTTGKMQRDANGGGKHAMEQPDVVIVLTTWPAEGHAVQMAETLVEERLAACVNVLPAMESVYRWQDEVERAAERQVVIKTTRRVLDALRERMRTLHPYDVPEFLVVPITGGGEAYLRWVGQCTGPKA